MATTLETTRWGATAFFTLRPDPGKPPLLDRPLLDALAQGLDGIERLLESDAHGDAPRVLVLRSDSDRHFCAGADLSVVRTLDRDSIGPWVDQGHAVLDRLERLPLPTLAAVRGCALGGGLEVALACDLIIAGPDASFGQVEGRMGLFPGWGGTVRLAERVGVATAKRLFFTGTVISVQEAGRIGLVDEVVASDEFDAAIERRCTEIAANGQTALAAYKRTLLDESLLQRDRIRELEQRESVRCITDSDTRRRMSAFFQSRSHKSA